jgi:hypothetical protein
MFLKKVLNITVYFRVLTEITEDFDCPQAVTPAKHVGKRNIRLVKRGIIIYEDTMLIYTICVRG